MVKFNLLNMFNFFLWGEPVNSAKQGQITLYQIYISIAKKFNPTLSGAEVLALVDSLKEMHIASNNKLSW